MILFIYYKVPPSSDDSLVQKIRRMQTQLGDAFPGLHMRLMKRPALDAEGNETFMETYELERVDTALFRKTLDELVQTCELPIPRKNEYFIHQ